MVTSIQNWVPRFQRFLERASPNQLRVQFRRRRSAVDLTPVIGDFSNELINQRIRHTLAEDTKAIRELIVSQAFAEARFETNE
jgi:His-Xaa-Ser system protein HxsD